ncbi:protein of unknown function [Weissella viridescens]|nr:protein of unknown function [Weissella viridescens]
MIGWSKKISILSGYSPRQPIMIAISPRNSFIK